MCPVLPAARRRSPARRSCFQRNEVGDRASVSRFTCVSAPARLWRQVGGGHGLGRETGAEDRFRACAFVMQLMYVFESRQQSFCWRLVHGRVNVRARANRSPSRHLAHRIRTSHSKGIRLVKASRIGRQQVARSVLAHLSERMALHTDILAWQRSQVPWRCTNLESVSCREHVEFRALRAAAAIGWRSCGMARTR